MKKQYWITAATFVLIGHLSGNPTGGQAITGDLTFHFHGKTLEIRAPDQSVVHWEDFSIDAGELTRFIQPSASATVLNKVLGLNPSLINGALEANGKVILINPQGVIVGKGGIIRTADFIASTLDRISSSAEGLEFTGDSTASIVNYGTIKTAFGDVVLIATTVTNSGSVDAPQGKVLIGAGSNVLLSPSSEERIFIRPSLSSGSIENNGLISATEVALKTEGSAYALAINAGGLIQATDVVESNGKILLIAEGGLLTVNGKLESPKGTVELRGDQVFLDEAAHIDVSSNTGGGTVLIGTHHLKNAPSNIYSDRVYVDPKAQIKADALVQGDGGTVMIWSESATQAYGAISGRGGPQGGDGGFVELSGRNYLVPRSLADLRAPLGKTGTLLIDPSDVLISSSPGTTVAFNTCPTPATLVLVNTIQDSVLVTQLNAACVIIDTSVGPGATTGNITVDQTANVAWSSSNPLTLTANDTLTIQGIINCTAGTPGGDINLITTTGPTGTILIGGTGITAPAQVMTSKGNITISAENAVTVQAGSGGHGMGDALVQGVVVNITANGAGNVFNVDSSTSSTWAQVISTASSGNQTLSINTPTAGGNFNITANNGGFIELNSGQGVSFIAAGDFLIPNADNATPTMQSVYIRYVTVSGVTNSVIQANNFNISVNPSGNVQFDQQDSPTVITAANDFIFDSQGNVMAGGRGNGLVRMGQPLIMNIGRDLIFTLDGGIGNANGQAPLETLCNVTLNATIGRDFQMLNTSNKGTNEVVGSTGLTLSAGRDVMMNKSAGTIAGNDLLLDCLSGNLSVQAGHDITVGIESTVASGADQILMIAGRNFNMTDPTSLIDVNAPTGKGSVILVADNLFQPSPNAGPGQFNMQAGQIQPTTALNTPVQIYSSIRSQNTVNGTINTLTFVPGTLGVNTPIEEWGIWYPAAPIDQPVAPDFFKFYYKLVNANPTPTPTPTPTLTTIPNIPFADVAQIIGNLYDDIEIFQYDLPPYQDVFCVHVCNLQETAKLSRLKKSSFGRTWTDKESRDFEKDWMDYVRIDNYRKYYLNRQRIVSFYVGQQDEIDALNAVSCPNTLE